MLTGTTAPKDAGASGPGSIVDLVLRHGATALRALLCASAPSSIAGRRGAHIRVLTFLRVVLTLLRIGVLTLNAVVDALRWRVALLLFQGQHHCRRRRQRRW